MDSEVKKNLERTKKGLSIKARVKDWWVQGFQLSKCYVPAWDEIKETFSEYDVDLNRHGPIITIQTLKQVRLAKEITEKIKDNKEIREVASRCSFPLRSVSGHIYDRDKVIDGNIFIAVLRLLPEFNLRIGAEQLGDFLENGNSKEYLEQVLLTTGTLMETHHDIEGVVEEMVKRTKIRKTDKLKDSIN